MRDTRPTLNAIPFTLVIISNRIAREMKKIQRRMGNGQWNRNTSAYNAQWLTYNTFQFQTIVRRSNFIVRRKFATTAVFVFVNFNHQSNRIRSVISEKMFNNDRLVLPNFSSCCRSLVFAFCLKHCF